MRQQFPIVLGWALTPWKAQGSTLKKAIVKLGNAVNDPGVLFVALSRVRHPDDLMLDDDFPDFTTILKQSRNPSFKTRQDWERRARSKFSKTIRHHMRDPELFSAEKRWTQAESDLADAILKAVQINPTLSDEYLLSHRRSFFFHVFRQENVRRIKDFLLYF